MRKSVVIALLAVVAIGLIGWAARGCLLSGMSHEYGNSTYRVLRVQITQDPTSLDPAILMDTETSPAVTAQFAPLGLIDSNGAFISVLAQSIKVDEDGLGAEITLRPDIKFSNGKEVQSLDVRDTLERFYHGGHPERFVLERIVGIDQADPIAGVHADGIQLIDPHRLRIRFKLPEPHFVQQICTSVLGIVESESLKKPKKPLDSQLVGAGPFALSESQPGVRYIYRRNPGFPLDTGIEELQLIVVESDRDALARLATGQLDVLRLRGTMLAECIERSSGGQPKLRSQWNQYHIVDAQTDDLVFILLNWNSPALSAIAPEDRKAVMNNLSQMLPRRAICDAIYAGYASPVFALDPRASGPTSSMPVKGMPREIELLTAQVSELRKLGEYIKPALTSSGIPVEVRALQPAQLLDRIIKKDYAASMLWMEANIYLPPALWWSTFFREGAMSVFAQPLPDIGPRADEVRSQVELARQGPALDALMSLMSSQQEAWIPIAKRKVVYAVAPRVRHLGLDGVGVLHFSLLRTGGD